VNLIDYLLGEEISMMLSIESISATAFRYALARRRSLLRTWLPPLIDCLKGFADFKKLSFGLTASSCFSLTPLFITLLAAVHAIAASRLAFCASFYQEFHPFVSGTGLLPSIKRPTPNLTPGGI